MEITTRNNGPLLVTGSDIVLKDAAGNAYDLAGRESIALCRCGHSQDKPFCDGSHKVQGFQCLVEARALPPPKPKLPF